MTIYFYTIKDKYGEFSNFSKYGIHQDGKWWKTTEHYFQAQKFIDEEYQEKIRNAPDAKTAANLGRSRKISIKHDWEEIKDDIMRKAVLNKFQTHKNLQKLLLATNNEKLVEAAPGDYYWGCGADGSGKNMLGIILEEVRNKIGDKTCFKL
ncbi:MAG: NADAR family protein [Candidatus Marithrix sp.]